MYCYINNYSLSVFIKLERKKWLRLFLYSIDIEGGRRRRASSKIDIDIKYLARWQLCSKKKYLRFGLLVDQLKNFCVLLFHDQFICVCFLLV